MDSRIDHLVTSGTFSLDGQTFDVDNNVWLLGDDNECIVFDAPHDVDSIVEAIDGRTLRAIVCTHAHDDHVRMAPELADLTGAPILLHPADRPLWELTHPQRSPDAPLSDGQVLSVADVEVTVMHTPGHAPGACSFYVEEHNAVFTGDTLFAGGPGATGRSFSDFPTIVQSIRRLLDELPGATRGPYRARRFDHVESRGAAPRRVDRTRPLTPQQGLVRVGELVSRRASARQ